VTTSFTPILQRAVERTPGALGAIFADWDGEAVDQFGRVDKNEMLVLGAHYGIILNHVQAVLRLFHFGEAVEVILHHDRMDLVVRAVGLGYYVVLVVKENVHLASALREVKAAAVALRAEMM
jgi:predicted regulator of Ras-like GTPase activity (Roadblock/LC7/MglB family)